MKMDQNIRKELRELEMYVKQVTQCRIYALRKNLGYKLKKL